MSKTGAVILERNSNTLDKVSIKVYTVIIKVLRGKLDVF